MKKILTIVLCCFFINGYSQHKKKKPTPKPIIVKQITYTITYKVNYQEMLDYGGTFVWEDREVIAKAATYTQTNLTCLLLDNTYLYIPKSQVVSIQEIKIQN